MKGLCITEASGCHSERPILAGQSLLMPLERPVTQERDTVKVWNEQ